MKVRSIVIGMVISLALPLAGASGRSISDAGLNQACRQAALTRLNLGLDTLGSQRLTGIQPQPDHVVQRLAERGRRRTRPQANRLRLGCDSGQGEHDDEGSEPLLLHS